MAYSREDQEAQSWVQTFVEALRELTSTEIEMNRNGPRQPVSFTRALRNW